MELSQYCVDLNIRSYIYYEKSIDVGKKYIEMVSSCNMSTKNKINSNATKSTCVGK